MARTLRSCLMAAAEQLYQAAVTLVERMECGEEVSAKEIKEAAAALKELVAMKNALEEKQASKEQPAVKVVFEGEAEEWSK